MLEDSKGGLTPTFRTRPFVEIVGDKFEVVQVMNMVFHEFGDKNFPHILLIHGVGNSWWNYLRQAQMLSDKYHVILPTLNGHGEEYQKDYISTEDSALQIMAYPEEIENYYMEDIPRIPIKTLVTMYQTYMGRYTLKNAITESKAQVLYIYGEKEMSCVKESAKLFKEMHPNCTLYEAKGYNHGYLSAYLPLEWMALVNPFFENNIY